MVTPTVLCKLVLAVLLMAAILASACVRAPRRSPQPAQLRRLVGYALVLYAVGGLASMTHHTVLAGLAYGGGIVVAALAAWLSRGRDQEDPPGGDDPVREPPPEPDGTAPLDWARFERDFRNYARSRGGRGSAPHVAGRS
ncbi:MAG: hypothetical protein WAL63_04560 [Solirubrobacteraceae bacterium]